MPALHPRPAHHTVAGFLEKIGRISLGLIGRILSLLSFFGVICIVAGRVFLHPRRLRLTALVAQMEQTGVNAVPIVGLLSFLIGVVLAYQGADQLRRFGAEIYTVNLLGIGILRELGVLMAAIIIAGRSGSAFTAQIGTMRVNEEIDAMRTIGLDPVEVLVIPRLFGLMLTLPMLTLCANLLGILGGALMSWSSLGITPPQFTRQLQSALYAWTFWIGLVKAPFFAFIIALIGCYEGFQVAAQRRERRPPDHPFGSRSDLSCHRRRRGFFDRLFHSADLTCAEHPDEPIIRVRGLVNRFGAETVHDGLDLDVRRGEVLGSWAVPGPGNRSCCGPSSDSTGRPQAKSKFSGAMFWAMSDAQRRELEKRWGVLFQDGALFSSLTVAQNIEVPIKEYLRHAAAPHGRDLGGQSRHGRAARGRRGEISRRSCLEACANAPGSPAPLPSIRKSSFSTSPLPASIR